MKFKWDKKYLYWGITAFIVIVASLIFYSIIFDSEGLLNFFGVILSAFSPVILGFAFAYLINPLYKILTFNIFKKWGLKIFKGNEKKAKSFQAGISLFITMIIVLAAIFLLLWMIIPKLYESVQTIVMNLPTYYDNIKNFLLKIFADNSAVSSSIIGVFNSLSNKLQHWIRTDLLSSLGTYANSIVSGVVGVISGFLNVIIGLIVAIYVLAEKEHFSAQAKKILYSITKTNRATKIIEKTKFVDKVFTGFISGKIIDSIIIGILCYITLLIFDMPYKELVAVIVGVTNVIPFFGPFIGAIPSALLILMVSPVKALIFVIIIIVLQQLDGNIIGPKILGESTGLSGFFVLCSMLVFGSLFGFIGMLIGVPTFAVIYTVIKNFSKKRLKDKNIYYTTEEYKYIDYIDPATSKPVYKKVAGEEKEVKKFGRPKFRKRDK